MRWISILLLFFSSAVTSYSESGSAYTNKFIIPALQVLTYITEADWKSELTLDAINELRTILQDEAKKTGVTKFTGFSDSLLDFLTQTSDTTAKEQLEMILSQMIKEHELETPKVLKLTETFLEIIRNEKSELNYVLNDLHPLVYN